MSLRRSALLIESSNVTGHKELPGVLADTRRYKQFLQSEAGGAWRDSEIQIISHPTRDRLIERLNWQKAQADFAFIVFGGHGCHYQELRSTSLCISDRQEMLVRELNPGVARQILIVDTCRRFEKLIEASAVSEETRALAFSSDGYGYRASCRVLYDKAISESPEGRTILYSCDLNQVANDDGTGGAFSMSLLNVSRGWASVFSGNQYTAARTLNVERAFGLAKSDVEENYAPQRPVIDNGRADATFPFAVA